LERGGSSAVGRGRAGTGPTITNNTATTTLQWQPPVLPLEHGGSSAVGRGRAGTGPTTTNNTATTTLQR